MKKPITLKDYLKHRDEEFPHEWTVDKEESAIDLLFRVNRLLEELGVEEATVSSGWRPMVVNSATPSAAKHSYHLTGKAIDIVDNKLQDLADLIRGRPELLAKYELWMEDPAATINPRGAWVHLDTGKRSDREIRIFKPKVLG